MKIKKRILRWYMAYLYDEKQKALDPYYRPWSYLLLNGKKPSYKTYLKNERRSWSDGRIFRTEIRIFREAKHNILKDCVKNDLSYYISKNPYRGYSWKKSKLYDEGIVYFWHIYAVMGGEENPEKW